MYFDIRRVPWVCEHIIRKELKSAFLAGDHSIHKNRNHCHTHQMQLMFYGSVITDYK